MSIETSGSLKKVPVAVMSVSPPSFATSSQAAANDLVPMADAGPMASTDDVPMKQVAEQSDVPVQETEQPHVQETVNLAADVETSSMAAEAADQAATEEVATILPALEEAASMAAEAAEVAVRCEQPRIDDDVTEQETQLGMLKDDDGTAAPAEMETQFISDGAPSIAAASSGLEPRKVLAYSKGMDLFGFFDDPDTCLDFEIQRCKTHVLFDTFYKKMFDDDSQCSWEFGDAEGDPVADLEEFWEYVIANNSDASQPTTMPPKQQQQDDSIETARSDFGEGDPDQSAGNLPGFGVIMVADGRFKSMDVAEKALRMTLQSYPDLHGDLLGSAAEVTLLLPRAMMFLSMSMSMSIPQKGFDFHMVLRNHIISYLIISNHITSHHTISDRRIISYRIISYHLISYHIISHHIIPYQIESYHIISHHIIPYQIESYHIISYHILSYPLISYHIISYHIISYHIISYHIISYHLISYPFISSHIISYHIISSQIISYHVISYQLISYHIVSDHIISYHIESYHIISYRIISYHIRSHNLASYHIVSYHIRIVSSLGDVHPDPEAPHGQSGVQALRELDHFAMRAEPRICLQRHWVVAISVILAATWI